VNDPRIIVALDFPGAEPALALAARLDPARCALKIGKELFTREGPALISTLAGTGHRVFLDLKYHDIPSTVAGACRAASDLGAWMIDVHAAGGRRMLEAAVRALGDHAPKPLLVAVTVLTSLDEADLRETGVAADTAGQVRRLAALSAECGVDGLVCSPREIDTLRSELGQQVRLVTPGIRPAGAEAGDQKRVMTPAQAVRAGATHLVVGRPITAARDPMAALAAIEEEIGAEPGGS